MSYYVLIKADVKRFTQLLRSRPGKITCPA